jgi:hypothetical protein
LSGGIGCVDESPAGRMAAVHALAARLPDAFLPAAVGTSFRF